MGTYSLQNMIFFLPIYESLLEKILVLGFRADVSIWYEFECDDDLLPAQFSSDREWGSLYNQKSLENEEDKMIMGKKIDNEFQYAK